MLICAGDLHVDALERHIPGAYKRVIATFGDVLDSANTLGASAVIQLGDVFDSAYPERYVETRLLRTLRKRRKIPTYFIMGNHDFDSVEIHALNTLAWLCETGFINGKVFFEPEIFTIEGDKYYFCPHPYVSDQPKGVRYSFGHFGYDGAKGDNNFSIKSGVAPKGRWVLGDYHTPQRGKNYIYAGSLTQVKWHESRDKSIIHIEDTVRSVAIKPRIILDRATINSADDLNSLDPEVYWSVKVSRKADLPPDWATKYPQVIRHDTEKTSSKRAQILMKKVESEDPLEGLVDYLRHEGMSDKDIRRGYRLLGRADVQV